jgi:hypothetical protein
VADFRGPLLKPHGADALKEQQLYKLAKKAAKAAEQEAAKKMVKDEKHRNLLDLSTGEWELLDEDGKADRVELYYVEKKKEKRAAKSKKQKDEKHRNLLDLPPQRSGICWTKTPRQIESISTTRRRRRTTAT